MQAENKALRAENLRLEGRVQVLKDEADGLMEMLADEREEQDKRAEEDMGGGNAAHRATVVAALAAERDSLREEVRFLRKRL